MNKDLEFLDDFVTNNAARGLITMGYYIKLKTAIEHLELELNNVKIGKFKTILGVSNE